jgi:hypothetical protein
MQAGDLARHTASPRAGGRAVTVTVAGGAALGGSADVPAGAAGGARAQRTICDSDGASFHGASETQNLARDSESESCLAPAASQSAPTLRGEVESEEILPVPRCGGGGAATWRASDSDAPS